MAKKALVEQQKVLEKKFFWYKLGENKKPKHITKFYSRCKLCGRPHWYMREFWVCRCCFRKHARLWNIMWVKKASR